MKTILAVSIFAFFSGASSFASDVCIVTWANGGYYNDGKARENIGCNKGNGDTKDVVEKNGDNDVPTVLARLMGLGYKIVASDKESYTLAK